MPTDEGLVSQTLARARAALRDRPRHASRRPWRSLPTAPSAANSVYRPRGSSRLGRILHFLRSRTALASTQLTSSGATVPCSFIVGATTTLNAPAGCNFGTLVN